MFLIKVVGIDLAKLIFSIYGTEEPPCVRIVVASINFINKQGAVS